MSTELSNKKVIVIGIGGTGIKILNAMADIEAAQWLELLAIDTDAESLAACTVKNKITADFKWRNGQGCGGEVIKGQRSLSRERGRINELLGGVSLLIVTGALGGGTATGGTPVIASVARSMNVPTIFIMTTPFAFEGHTRRRIAEDGVRELLPAVDIMIVLPNDLLFSSLPSDAPVTEAFAKADKEVAAAVLGISEIMRCKNLLAADFADFYAVLNKRKSSCSIGVGSADDSEGLNKCHLALERMFDSPFLGGAERLGKANAVFLVLTGGSDLNMGEMKKTLEALEKFVNKESQLLIGANTDKTYGSTIRLVAVTVNFEDDENPSSSHAEQNASFFTTTNTAAQQKSRRENKLEFEQAELPLQNISRGIFLNTTPVTFAGEDLDVPTFQRKMLIVDKGD